MTIGILFISIVFMVIGMIVQNRLKSKFKEYSEVPTSSGLNGKQETEKMLKDNGIYDVQVVSVQGFLSDHYDPTKKTVNLSPDVYEAKNALKWAALTYVVSALVSIAMLVQYIVIYNSRSRD